ncbi:MAG: hypothetical protein RQ753_05530 [Desulfurivibrionaceae bacterium]|nr:hypothetical protein [Desulfobulbales bacterium]MDT8335138.1 hypothetical protein [Desulfurivibrionaceae bacterium]
MRKRTIFSPILLILLAATILPDSAAAEVDWQTRETITTAKAPLAIQVTADGKRTFILTAGGNLEIYDSNARIIDTIKVDPAMNLLSTDGAGNRVFLGNAQNSSVHEIMIEYIAEFDYEGSPYLGKSQAPVVLAVFSDFE